MRRDAGAGEAGDRHLVDWQLSRAQLALRRRLGRRVGQPHARRAPTQSNGSRHEPPWGMGNAKLGTVPKIVLARLYTYTEGRGGEVQVRVQLSQQCHGFIMASFTTHHLLKPHRSNATILAAAVRYSGYAYTHPERGRRPFLPFSYDYDYAYATGAPGVLPQPR